MWRPIIIVTLVLSLIMSTATALFAQDQATADLDPASVLTEEQWKEVDRSVDGALAWLASQQRPDGSFPTQDTGQPAVTSLCLLAFLSRGHLPGKGVYGDQVSRGIDYVLSCQQPDGLFLRRLPKPTFVHFGYTHTGMYNHAIAGLLLCEVYGMTDERRAARIEPKIEEAIAFTRKRQLAPKQDRRDLGGWRYLGPRKGGQRDADLSITAWQLTFWRSARNAGFEVPSQWIDEAVEYVQRCFNSRQQTTVYFIGHNETSRAMAGAGVLSLSLAGLHNAPMARATGRWILQHPFDQYNQSEHYHYSAFYCTQATFQLGGHYWQQFFPPVARTLVANQRRDGSWAPEIAAVSEFGNAYTTALAVLVLNTPNQLLPVFQR